MGSQGTDNPREAEVKDLYDRYECNNLPLPLPYPTFGAAGGYVRDRVHICGGTLNFYDITDACYSYNTQVNNWEFAYNYQLGTARTNVAGVQINNTHYWITGNAVMQS